MDGRTEKADPKSVQDRTSTKDEEDDAPRDGPPKGELNAQMLLAELFAHPIKRLDELVVSDRSRSVVGRLIKGLRDAKLLPAKGYRPTKKAEQAVPPDVLGVAFWLETEADK